MSKANFCTIIQFTTIKPISFGYKGKYGFEDTPPEKSIIALQIDNRYYYVGDKYNNLRYVTHTLNEPVIHEVPPKNTPIALLRLYIKQIKKNYIALSSPTFFECRVVRISETSRAVNKETPSWEKFSIRFLDEFYIVNSSGVLEKIVDANIESLETYKPTAHPKNCDYLIKHFKRMTQETELYKPLLEKYSFLYLQLPKLEKRIRRYEKRQARKLKRKTKKAEKLSNNSSGCFLDFLLIVFIFAIIMVIRSFLT